MNLTSLNSASTTKTGGLSSVIPHSSLHTQDSGALFEEVQGLRRPKDTVLRQKFSRVDHVEVSSPIVINHMRDSGLEMTGLKMTGLKMTNQHGLRASFRPVRSLYSSELPELEPGSRLPSRTTRYHVLSEALDLIRASVQKPALSSTSDKTISAMVDVLSQYRRSLGKTHLSSS